MKGSAVFLDTTIQIARLIHSKDTKRRIAERLCAYGFTVTGEIVKQEFKRRLLQEAKSLLRLLDKHNSFSQVLHQVQRWSHPLHRRKQQIHIQMIATLFGNEGGPSLVERAKLHLHYLITQGIDDFEEDVGMVIRASGCACARCPIQEKVRYKQYDFGPDRCSDPGAAGCQIGNLLKTRVAELEKILRRLQKLTAQERTAELGQAAEFITAILQDATVARSHDPCYKIGDLIIALESHGIPTFFTMNGKESQHFCRELDQTLIVRPSSPDKADVECDKGNTSWPKF